MKPHGNAWSDQKKIEVATAHCMGLKAPMIEAATGVPKQTIRHWRLQDWFKDLISEIQREEDNEVDAKFTRIVNKSLDAIIDRLENGDFMFNSKENKFVRKPLVARDINRIADTMFDKRNLIRGKPTSISAKQEQITDRLSKLALEFERFVKAKEIKGEVITDDNDGTVRVLSKSEIGEESRGTIQEPQSGSETSTTS